MDKQINNGKLKIENGELPTIHSQLSINKPLVRFPEFTDDWELKHGNELFERISNKNHNSDLPILAISQEFGAIPRELINYKISVTEKSVSSYKVVEKGDFIISLRSFQGGIEYSNYKGICSPAYIILRPSIDLDEFFFKIHFKTFRYIQQLKSKLEGIRDGKMVSYKYFSEIKLPFPQLPEQKKIAHFFTTLDKKLNQLQQKKSSLEAYKKGVVQLIMDNGKLKAKKSIRFKPNSLIDNGELKMENDIINSQLSTINYPDWEVKKLGEVANVYDGTHQTPKYQKQGIPFYSVEHVTANNFTKTKFITKEVFEKENKRVKLEKGDILMTRIGDIGTSKLIDWDVDASFYVSLALIKQSDKYNSKYLNQLISSVYFQNELWRRTIHVAFPKKINLGEISNCLVLLPSLKEQTKIANFLSKIDEKINAVNEQIDKTKTYKKGLLQKMFV